jgi:hypothetical protein
MTIAFRYTQTSDAVQRFPCNTAAADRQGKARTADHVEFKG